MRRIALPERPDWQSTARRFGFGFHTLYDQPYWCERHAYQFTLEQIERDLEAPTHELHQMCLQLVEDVVRSETLLSRLRVPPSVWDFVAESWRARDVSLYGRFDLRYDGLGPAKLYEYNADTPTSLYETAFFQWIWLDEMKAMGCLPAEADQYNSVQEKLIDRLRFFNTLEPLYFTCVADNTEDRATVEYIEDCARQALLETRFLYLNDIAVDTQGQFCDPQGSAIRHIFKLYPWEWMFDDEYAQFLPHCDTHFYEPPWKCILSNKGILPLLWERYRGHPHLLPAYFADDRCCAELGGSYARKPFFSREGANIQLAENGRVIEHVDGPYATDAVVLQALAPAPRFGDDFTVIGSWVVGDIPCGIGVREDTTSVTRNLSRFIPHFIQG